MINAEERWKIAEILALIACEIGGELTISMLNYRFLIFSLSLFIWWAHLPAKAQRDSESFTGLSRKKPPLSVNGYVVRGLILSDHPLAHATGLKPEIIDDLPPLDTLSKGTKLQASIGAFRLAIKRQRELKGYSISQVYSFLGRALMMLGVETMRQAETTVSRHKTLNKQAERHFRESFQSYRLALSNNPGDLEYTFAVDLVQAIITSGDLNRALAEIKGFEKRRLTPAPPSDNGLLYLRGEIYWVMGRFEDAGLAYEDWINRGIGQVNVSKGSVINEKLRFLSKTTGHPNKLPY